ncbi:MAG: hypothetical protein K2W95_12315 [Candidatus Obscuribacterales bacterium]|nr:hypothetical protein [Candidatus Obscuribacterales bacterium]
MNIFEIEEAVQVLVQDLSPETFIYRFLAAFGKPKSQITLVQKGTRNKSKTPGEVIWEKVILFRPVQEGDLHLIADQIRKGDIPSTHHVRFIMVTDFQTLLAVDVRTGETLDVPITELPKRVSFFLPLTGKEKAKPHVESEADMKAAGRMGKLYDEIRRDNPDIESHALNVFLCRLLFCYFAEDTNILHETQRGTFTKSLENHTQTDGSDLHLYLDRLFDVMNMKMDSERRSTYPDYLQEFPWVNGGLFAEKYSAPTFTKHSRATVIEAGKLDWSKINPDIFGSMMQAVVSQEEGKRKETGMHYTSVSNIMKVLEPLFLDELQAELLKNSDSAKGLEALLERLYNIQVFDPACGSGNFLIIAYKELRKLEMAIYQRLRDIKINKEYRPKGVIFLPKIRLTQFSGIEIDDFAHEIAVLSMWLAEHQMNIEFREEFHQVIPPLPLKESGNIVCKNATEEDWETVCKKSPDAEIYVLGNPPYLGARFQDAMQKADVERVFKDAPSARKLDYIACWFLKGARYIKNSNAQLAFVSTNSICQGQLVSILWPHLLREGVEISFGHKSFQWSNNAKNNAGVTVIIVGLRNPSKGLKSIYNNGHVQKVQNITPYLTTGRSTIVYPSNKPIADLPEMVYGNMATDGGCLMLSPQDRKAFVAAYPDSSKFIKRVYGAEEFIKGIERWCLWISDEDLDEALSIPPIAERIEACRQARLRSSDEGAHKLAKRPHQFRESRMCKVNSIIVPTVSSEMREYIPIGFLTKEDIIIAPNQAIYDPEFWIMGILCSKMHNVWVRAVGGRMRTDIRYSNVLCYNTFPLPVITSSQKEALGNHVINVISERENHAEKTLAHLYNPLKMPASLREAHQELDAAVDHIYKGKGFVSDDARLEFLLGMYEDTMCAAKTGG